MKRIFITISVLGMFILLGTAGTSDLEMETGRILMTDTQLFLQLAIGIIMFKVGLFAASAYNTKESHNDFPISNKINKSKVLKIKEGKSCGEIHIS